MPSETVKRKFQKPGRKAAFARFAKVKPSAVSMWFSSKSPSARLDRLARSWRPTLDAQPVPSCDRPGCPGVVAAGGDRA